MMKRLLSLGIAAATMLLLAVPAFGAGTKERMEISLRLTSDGVDVTGEGLRPGQEYRFPILVQYEDEVPSHLREAELEGRQLIATIQEGGTVLAAPRTVIDGGRCYLVVETKASYGTKPTQTEVLVRLRDQATGEELSQDTARLEVGSLRMEDTAADIGEGEAVPIDNSRPVVTAGQFRQLAEGNHWRAVTLNGEGWKYTVNVTGLGERNLYSTAAVMPELVEKYPEREFRFLSFPGAPDFETQGTLTVDVSDIVGEFGGDFYLYRKLGDRLYYLKSQYDEAEGTLEFRPSQLGSYVITDQELGDLELSRTGSGNSISISDDAVVETLANPETGARGVAGAALALVATTMTAVLAIRKKSWR